MNQLVRVWSPVLFGVDVLEEYLILLAVAQRSVYLGGDDSGGMGYIGFGGGEDGVSAGGFAMATGVGNRGRCIAHGVDSYVEGETLEIVGGCGLVGFDVLAVDSEGKLLLHVANFSDEVAVLEEMVAERGGVFLLQAPKDASVVHVVADCSGLDG